MNMHGELGGDVNEGTRKTSEIQAKKTSDNTSHAKTSHDDQTEVLDKDNLEQLNDAEQSLLKVSLERKMKMHEELCGDVHEGITKKASEILEAEKTADQTCQATTSHDHQIEVLDQDFLDGLPSDERWIVERLRWKPNDGDSAQKDREYSRSSDAKIQKVLPILLQNQNIKKHLEPREIAIGPIYADVYNLSKGELKIKLAEKFIKNWGKTAMVALLKEIKTKIKNLRSCFDERLRRDWRFGQYLEDKSFLFEEGCAVIEFIHSYVSNELEEVGISSTQAEFIQQDLFLFENQIPFQVLTLLMDAMDTDTAHMEATIRPSYHFKVCIIQFVHMNNIFTTNKVFHYDHSRQYYSQMIGALDKIKPFHLLDLLHKVSIFGSIMDVQVDKDERDDGNFVLKVFDQPKDCLLSLDNCFGERSCLTDYGRVEERYLRTIQELKSSGITMKLSNSQDMKSIDFSTYCFGIFGHIKLPALNVNDSTVRKLFNLVAYEMCLDVKERRYSFTSYLNFLDMLVDTEQDVEDLRTTRILMRNALGSDAKVAEFFNTLQLTYLPMSDQDHFQKIHCKIEEHYLRKCKIRMARIYTAYVRNPWPTLGLLLTLIALVFTVVQTWFAINPRN